MTYLNALKERNTNKNTPQTPQTGRIKRNPKMGLGDIEIPMPDFSGLNSNLIESDNHTLIVKNYPAEMRPYEDEEGLVPGIFEEIPEVNIYKLFLSDFMDESGHGLHKVINRLQEASNEDRLELHIASYGGSFTEVVQIHNIVNTLYMNRCTTYLNNGYSGGAAAFCMGNERICYKHSTAMFHFFSGGERGKGSDMMAALTHSIDVISAYYRDTLSDFFSEEEMCLMINNGKEYWMDSTQMMNRGIATGIIIDGLYYSADKYFEKYDENGDIKASWIKAQAAAEKKLENQLKRAEKAIETKMLKAQKTQMKLVEDEAKAADLQKKKVEKAAKAKSKRDAVKEAKKAKDAKIDKTTEETKED